jgi:hypothetical protein
MILIFGSGGAAADQPDRGRDGGRDGDRDSASSQPPSMSWKCQNRLVGSYDAHCV